jgi:hypothetical protein
MTEQQKADAYGQLLNEHTRIANKVAEIKGQNIELTKDQQKQIEILQNKQIQIMSQIKNLFN